MKTLIIIFMDYRYQRNGVENELSILSMKIKFSLSSHSGTIRHFLIYILGIFLRGWIEVEALKTMGRSVESL